MLENTLTKYILKKMQNVMKDIYSRYKHAIIYYFINFEDDLNSYILNTNIKSTKIMHKLYMISTATNI